MKLFKRFNNIWYCDFLLWWTSFRSSSIQYTQTCILKW